MEPWTTSASSPTPASKMPKPRFEHLNNSFKHKVTPHPTTSFRLLTRKNKISHRNQTYQHQPTTNHAHHQPHPTNEQHQQPRSHNKLPKNQEHYRTWASKHAVRKTLLLQHAPPLLAVQVTLLHKPQSPTYRTASKIYQAQTPHVLSPQPHRTQSQPKQWTLGLKTASSKTTASSPSGGIEHIASTHEENPKSRAKHVCRQSSIAWFAGGAGGKGAQWGALQAAAVCGHSTRVTRPRRSGSCTVFGGMRCVFWILITFSTWRFLWHCCLSNIPTCCSWFLFSSLVY